MGRFWIGARNRARWLDPKYFDEAIKWQQNALEDKDYTDYPEEAEKAGKRLESYKQKKPWRE